MNPRIRALGDKLLRLSPAQLIMNRAADKRLAVLAYHAIDEAAAFGRQLDYLCSVANPISLSQLVAHLTNGSRLPRRPLLITFDDGDPSVIRNAAPELRRRGLSAVAFVVPGYIDTHLPFWWEEVAWLRRGESTPSQIAALVGDLKRRADSDRRAAIELMRSERSGPAPRREQLTNGELLQLADYGVDVGNHSLTHPILTRCTREVLDLEIGHSHLDLKKRLDCDVRVFAYPNGDHNEQVVKTVLAHGYEAAFCFDHRMQKLPIRDPLRISRLRVSSTTSIDRLSIIVSGLHPRVHRMLGRS